MRKKFLCNSLITASLFSLALTDPIYAKLDYDTDIGPGSKKSEATPSNASLDTLSLNLSLEEINSRRLRALEKANSLKEEIQTLSSLIKQTNICSEANRAYNQLSEKYNEYVVENYTAILYSTLYQLEDGDSDIFEEDIEALDTDKEALTTLLPSAEAKANALFNDEYELMCKIVNAEVGDSVDIEHFWECSMLENRKRDSGYPNTLPAVVYQRGQFSPTWNGQINKLISPRVRKNVEMYMRGHVETNMPHNVVYQASFPQGSGVWNHIPGGEYYCYK